MAGYVERGEVPGLVALVSRRGEVHVDAIGAMALGGSERIRRDTIFRISSMTKPIIAAATLILVEECTLRLDEPVPGRFGWDGGLGTSWSSDPKEDMVAILMTQCLGFPSGAYTDFWTLAYQAIDD
jgi:CubicO group peptidase (beta-lactamase class C family)